MVIGCALNKVFQNVFAPTTNERAMKLLFAIAVALNMDINTVDIKGAILYAKQKREVYILLPTKLTKGQKKYMILFKTLYGQADSPQAFYDDLSIFLLDNGYLRTAVDPCFFYKGTPGNKYLLTVIHVDDFAIAGDCIETIDEFVMMKAKYTLKRSTEVESFLGIRIQRLQDGSVMFTQTQRIDDMVKEYELEDVPCPQVPMDSKFSHEYQDDSPVCERTKYLSLLGTLMFVVKTRPDISFAVNRLATRTSGATEKTLVHYFE